MCGRATLSVTAEDLERTFGYAAPPGYRPRYNLAPGQDLLALVGGSERSGFRELRWGLMPWWSADGKIGSRLINARAETVARTPAFRDAFAERRCLVVVDGFYEWKGTAGGRRPYRVHLGGRPFTLAGVWDRWPRGATPLESCAVVTTRASAPVAPIHHRMPVVVPEADRGVWLDGTASRGDLDALLRPYDGGDLELYEVSTLVNRPANDVKACIAPLEESLFSST